MYIEQKAEIKPMVKSLMCCNKRNEKKTFVLKPNLIHLETQVLKHIWPKHVKFVIYYTVKFIGSNMDI